MIRFLYSYRLILLVLALSVLITGSLLVGCNSLSPIMSYQGRLTDASGNPLSGNYTFTFKLYPVSSGGTPVYTETKMIAVDNGLFDTSIGPTIILSGMRPDLLAQPLWLEVTVAGEVLSPRQQLLGAPYAFTLMPGAVISSTFATAIVGTATDAVLTVRNNSAAADDPLPALRVEGSGGLELVEVAGDSSLNDGIIYSEKANAGSDLRLVSNDSVMIHLDEKNSTNSGFEVLNGTNGIACRIYENGNLTCAGTKSSVVAVQDQQRALYAIESPGVWFEDFGNGTLTNGMATVAIDPLFAATVNLDDYHVFVTPLGDCNGLYVTNKTATGFEVHELGGGTANVAFDYRIVAKRLGYEDKRMEVIETITQEEER